MSSPITGQVAITATAQQLDTTNTAGACQAFVIKAPLSNAHAVYIGTTGVTTSTGHALDAGDEFQYDRSSQNGNPRFQLVPSSFYAVGTSGDVITWLASP